MQNDDRNQEALPYGPEDDLEKQQEDIDAVPLLASIQATRTPEGDELWDRAIDYERALQTDPDWEDKSRREVYKEVGRRLEQHLGPDAHHWLDDPEDELPAQAEPRLDLERASVDDLETAIESASDLDEFIEKALHG